jgi:hypothetical protein
VKGVVRNGDFTSPGTEGGTQVAHPAGYRQAKNGLGDASLPGSNREANLLHGFIPFPAQAGRGAGNPRTDPQVVGE